MKEKWGASRVIMGGCRHSFPLVGEPRICGRGGEGRCQSRGNGLDGLFGAENRRIVLKILGASLFVHGCMAVFVRRVCMCITSSNVHLCTAHRPQMGGRKIPQHRHCSNGLLWKPQMMSSDWAYLRVSLYCSGEITCFC